MKSSIAILLILLSSAAGAKRPKNCSKLDLSQLCKQIDRCRFSVPDIDVLCATNNRHHSKTERTLLKSVMVPYSDSSAPIILRPPQSVTVAPGGELLLTCMAEGAPPPHIQITIREFADMSPVTDTSTNTFEVEKGILNVVFGQDDVIPDDEGWYRCVARNSQGLVYEDAYVTVKDPCEDMTCPEWQHCEIDFYTDEAGCFCDYCDDHGGLVCASNCDTFPGACSLAAENCYMGTNITVMHWGEECPGYSMPEFVELPQEQLLSVYAEETVTLRCRAEPAGFEPGPPPIIEWYTESSEDYEFIHEGDVLEYIVTGDVMVSCYAHHCAGSLNHETYNLGATVHIFIEEEEPNVLVHNGASCQILGDPYISTFDNVWYKHKGICTYVLSMDCATAQWYIYGRFDECGAGTCLVSVTLYYGRQMVGLERGWVVGKMGAKVPIVLGETQELYEGISVHFDGEYVSLSFGQGNVIRYDGFNGVQILLSEDGRTCGLCGNQDPSANGFYSRQYGMVTDQDTFIASWRLNYRYFQCYDKEEVDMGTAEDAEEICSGLFNSEYISRCHDTVDPSMYKETCTRTFRTYRYPDYRPECGTLQAYVLSCQTSGVGLEDWRSETACSPVEDVQSFTIAQGCPQDYPPV